MSDILKGVRISITNSGSSELAALDANEGLKELFEQRQKILKEMNLAKKAAAELAAKPFQDSLAEIDRQYAMILSMISDT
jgi:hypothetical protein